jgi:hypothetical protein
MCSRRKLSLHTVLWERKSKKRAGECPTLRVRITVFIGALLIGLFDGESSLLQEPGNFVQEPLFEVAHCGA